jgi:hypothetical protein
MKTFDLICRMTRNISMAYREFCTKEDLFSLLDFMQQHSIPCWVHGGWALEGLTGKSRPHHDLDIIVDDQFRPKIEQLLSSSIVAQHIHKFEVDFGGAELDLVFFQKQKGRIITKTPRIIGLWPPDAFTISNIGRISGREFPIISPVALYVQIANPVRKKKPMLEKNKADLELILPFLHGRDLEEFKKYYPIENTSWNRLKVRFGF